MAEQATGTVPEMFIRYLVARDRERIDTMNAAIRAMTPEEQSLLREAAVMGFVHGNMHGSAHRGDPDAFPKDREIIAAVLGGCESAPGYPFLKHLMRNGERKQPNWADVGKAARHLGFTPEPWIPGEVHWGRRDRDGLIEHEHGWVNVRRRANLLKVDLNGSGPIAGPRHTASLVDPSPAEVLTAARLVGLVGAP